MGKLHIGQRIKARAKELRMGATELGILVNTSKQNIYSIHKRRTMDTGQLKKFSKALDYDFFALYSEEATEERGSENPTMAMVYEDVQLMREEIDKLSGQGDESLEGTTLYTLHKGFQIMRNEIDELKTKYESFEKGNQ